MRRLTATIREVDALRLDALAESRGVTVGEIVREALLEKLGQTQPPLTFLGVDTEPLGDRPTARELDEKHLYRPDDEIRTNPPVNG